MKIKTFIQWYAYRQKGLGGKDAFNHQCQEIIDKQIEDYCKENYLSITSVNHSIVEEFVRHNVDASCYEIFTKMVVTVVFHREKKFRILNFLTRL